MVQYGNVNRHAIRSYSQFVREITFLVSFSYPIQIALKTIQLPDITKTFFFHRRSRNTPKPFMHRNWSYGQH